ncbi:MAG: G5 domain-containing protein, partial [Anaerolineales bacterium]
PIYEGDRVLPVLETPLESDLDVRIQRAGWMKVDVDGRELQVRAAGETVADSLAGAGISLTGLDYTVPGLEEPMPESGEIQVIRVEEKVQVELEPVPFETVYQPLDTLELDSIQVVDSGTYGVLQNRVRIRLEDGKEVSRTVDEARVVVEPKPRRLGYGTKIVVRTLSTSYGTIEYWRAIPIYATSYSPCNLGVPYCGERTASGKSVQRGIVGVIRSWYNLMRGWPVFIPDYGPGTIEDIGAGIAGRDWIDLGFTDENFEPWHQWTTLYFLTPVPPLDSIPWILP